MVGGLSGWRGSVVGAPVDPFERFLADLVDVRSKAVLGEVLAELEPQKNELMVHRVTLS